VDEGWLVDAAPISVTTKFLREGIHSDKLSFAQKQQLEEQGIAPESLDMDADRMDKQAYVKDTNRKILQNLMEKGLRDATEHGPGKSIIFARNHIHAVLLGKLFQEMYPEYGPDYCAVIDYSNPRAEQLIDDFKTWKKDPVIAVSVDMLDTGIDIPEVLNLVFAKPVKSYVKFWQMIGRGTRLSPNLLGPGKDKKEFYLFDHWGNCEYFDINRAHEEAVYSQSLFEQLFEARLILAETALASYDKATFDRVMPLIRAMLNSLPDKSLPVQEKYRYKLTVLSGSALERFELATVDLLHRELSPLMRYVNIRGEKEACDFDLLLTNLQTEILVDSAKVEKLKADVDNTLAGLRTNIEVVKIKFEHIKEMREKAFWERPKPDLLTKIEEKRQSLRGIVQYSLTVSPPPRPLPIILDIDDSDVHYIVRDKVRPSAQEMLEYRQRVRKVLEPHFATAPPLRKIRRGDGLTEDDFDALTALTLTQNTGVDLEILREFYPEMPQLQRELRAIVGMDADAVKERFAVFYHKYPGLNSLQTAFLNLLQKHIQTYGPVRLESLYKAPFIHMSAEGPEGIFKDEAQLHDLVAVLQTFPDAREISV
jgi:type I restriction enzyme R subunit